MDRDVEGSRHSEVRYSCDIFLQGISGTTIEMFVRITVLGTEDQTPNPPNTKIAEM
jgi:hypothetical protein